jgi:hypothetical protein
VIRDRSRRVQELGDRAFSGQPDIKEFPVQRITKP